MPSPAKPMNPSDRKRADQAEYLQWSALTKDQRIATGAPLTEVAWAELHKRSASSVRKWRDEPDFAARLAAVEQVAEPVSFDAEFFGDHDEIPSARSAMQQTFDNLATLAMGGDMRAVKILLDGPWAKEYREMSAAATDFASVPDDELDAEYLSLLAEADIASYLESRGWVCTPPAPVEPVREQLPPAPPELEVSADVST